MSLVAKAFTFERKDSWLFKLNPYFKVLMGLLLIAFSLILFSALKAILLLLFMILIGLTSKNLRGSAGSFALSLPFSIIIFLGEFLLTRSLISGLGYSMRFINLVYSASVIFTSISPDEIDYLIRRTFKARDIAFLISTTYKFIPVLSLDLQQIIEVQKGRGVDFSSKNPFLLIKNYYSVLVPLFVVSILRSQQMAEALELRGYGVSKEKSFYYEYSLQMKDIVIFAFFIIVLLFIYFI